VLGLILPPIYVDYRRGVMQQQYRHAFPDFMDLLVVCVESGQSLQSAIDRVGHEMLQVCPELGANLHMMGLELRAGSTLPAALKGLSERIGLEEVQSLAVLLKQSEELGSGIALALRTYSDEMREKRLSRAETRANALPVKMTIPLGLCVFPVILLVIMVPALIRLKNAFV
jgi:tight adherence protein C